MNSSILKQIRVASFSQWYIDSVRMFSTKTSVAAEEKIVIPKRIQRGATDILRALESTISQDPTAAHYKYHDDPYLIPKSNVGKRAFALAQEAGRKAALWVRQEHADLFQHREADPLVEMFFPKMVYNEQSDVTVKDLESVIKDAHVSDAVTVYRLLRQKDVAIPPELLQSLLELFCFYNSEDPLPEELIEERWFRQSSKGKERVRKTWKDGSFAEEIFISIDNPNSEAYSAIIQGMAKYYQVDRAWQLFEEARQKGIVVNTDAYNAMINVANFLKENYDMRWTFVETLLCQMNQAGLKPNLGTLNAVLHSLSTMGGGRSTKARTLQTIAEFKRLGVQPSLASWYFVLITYCKERGPVSTILYDIMSEVENKEHTIQDIRDTSFFVTAMDICKNHLRDCELAKRVNKLLNLKNNYDLIGDSFKESIYYRHYFTLLCATEPIEEFMNEFYYKFVPHIYVPEPGVMSDILKQIAVNAAIEHIPKLWSDMVVFDHGFRQNLIEEILNIMITNKPLMNEDLTTKFADIGWDIFQKIEGQPAYNPTKLEFTGEILGNILTLVLWNNDFEKACKVMDTLDKGHHRIVGVPKIEALSLFIDHCIEQKQPTRAIMCIQFCADSGFQVETLAARLNEKLTLDERHLNELSKIIGNPATMSNQ